MGTNFYALWDIAPDLRKTLHIGKRSNGGISTFQGSIFPTVEAWRTFLRQNQQDITIEDENGITYSVDEFFEQEVFGSGPGAAKTQFKAVRALEWRSQPGLTVYPDWESAKEHFDQDASDGMHWRDDDWFFTRHEFS